MIARLTEAALLVFSLAACDGMSTDAETPGPAPSGECNADGVRSLIGQTATGEVGARLLRETGARTLRWVPPRTAVTMDFSPDRLTVSYDDAHKITAISCG